MAANRVPLPARVRAFASRGPAWAAYVAGLPGLLDALLEEWSLGVAGQPLSGHGSVVVPVRTDTGAAAMLKIAFADDEGEHEALALQRWGGHGAVRLLRADPHRRALLLERADTTDLHSVGVLEACDVVAGLYRRLHVPAPPQLRTVASYLGRWTEPLAALPRNAPVPHRLVAQALGLARDLEQDPSSAGVIVHGDLHYGNVLAADRVGEPGSWLVIDPKPMSGDPHYEPAPMLWNRWDELLAERGGVRAGLRRRLHALVDAAGLDEERARAWAVWRMVVDAYWTIEAAERGRRPMSDEDRLRVTVCLTIAKAVQD